MGRKTYESIGKLLPERDNIIISRQEGYAVEGASVFNNVDAAIQFAGAKHGEVFIIGGQQLYEQTIAQANRLYITFLEIEGIEGDTYFPPYAPENYRTVYENTESPPEYRFYSGGAI